MRTFNQAVVITGLIAVLAGCFSDSDGNPETTIVANEGSDDLGFRASDFSRVGEVVLQRAMDLLGSLDNPGGQAVPEFWPAVLATGSSSGDVECLNGTGTYRQNRKEISRLNVSDNYSEVTSQCAVEFGGQLIVKNGQLIQTILEEHDGYPDGSEMTFLRYGTELSPLEIRGSQGQSLPSISFNGTYETSKSRTQELVDAKISSGSLQVIYRNLSQPTVERYSDLFAIYTKDLNTNEREQSLAGNVRFAMDDGSMVFELSTPVWLKTRSGDDYPYEGQLQLRSEIGDIIYIEILDQTEFMVTLDLLGDGFLDFRQIISWNLVR